MACGLDDSVQHVHSKTVNLFSASAFSEVSEIRSNELFTTKGLLNSFRSKSRFDTMRFDYWTNVPWKYRLAETGAFISALVELGRYSEIYRFNTQPDFSDFNRTIANVGAGMLFGYAVGWTADLITAYNKSIKAQELFEEAERRVRQRQGQHEDP